MKQTLLTLALTLLIIFAGFTQDFHEYSGSQACSMRKSLQRSTVLPVRAPMSGQIHSFDVLNYTVDFNLYRCYTPPNPKDYKATLIVTLKAVETIDTVRLNAENASLIIDSVRLAGQSFLHSGDILAIKLNRVYQPGEVLQVKVGFHHTNLNDGGFYCTNYHNAAVVFTDSEPQGARKWFPCWDDPSDKATLDLRARVKSNVRLGSNGILADSLIQGDTLTYHWISVHPIATYIMVMTSRTNYNLDILYWKKTSNPNDSIPIRFYYNPTENPVGIENIMFDLADYYSMRYNEHPFQKNGFATIDTMFTWGGMENQTLTSLCKGCWSESLVAHEFAHQWFGDMITCASWADIWINEGFATWCEANWNENNLGYQYYKAEIQNYAMDYKINNPGWAISVPEWAVSPPESFVLFNWQVTYEKGACILHQLRYLLGDTLFFSTLRTYAADTTFRFKNASIPDFNTKVNEMSGENYDWYFTDWLLQPNHPIYNNTYNIVNLGGGQWKVNFHTYQEQSIPEFFRMNLEVNVRFTDGTDSTFRFMNNVDHQSYEWFFDKQPVNLIFDPHGDIVLSENTTTVGIIDHPAALNLRMVSCVPNPAQEQTTITFETDREDTYRAVLTEMNGKTLSTLSLGDLPQGRHSFSIDCSHYPQGMYLYTISGTSGSINGRLIIDK